MTVSREVCSESVLLINKKSGMTSFDVIARIRKILGQKRIGHAGTLDKAATGLLVVCTGRMTRLSRYLIEKDKCYTGVLKLGITTDSCDREGAVTSTQSTTGVTESLVREAVASFKGSIMQRPPEFSAIKIAGQRASDITRKGGSVEMKERPIEIYSVETVALDLDDATVTIEVECSKGTYIRSLARDIGAKLGCGAYLKSLERTKSGNFLLSNALTIEELDAAILAGSSDRKFCLSGREALDGMETVEVDDHGAERVLHGGRLEKENVLGLPEHSGVYAIADRSENLIAIAVIDIDNWSVKYHNVFN